MRIINSLELLRGVDNIPMADSLVVSASVMLGGVIGSISCAFFPEELEEALRSAALEPVEPHVHAFGGLGDHRVHREAMGGVVVSCDGRWAWLCMSHFLERCA
jgi:hypothetical protein